MTMELKAGPELDRAVAEAVGGNCGFYLFRPSTDLNAAFAAAEKVGLWGDWVLTDQYLPDLSEIRNGWGIWEFEQLASAICGGDGDPAIVHSTPALAICAAILKSSEEAKNKVEKL